MCAKSIHNWMTTNEMCHGIVPCNPRLHTKLTDQLSCLYVYINKTDESKINRLSHDFCLRLLQHMCAKSIHNWMATNEMCHDIVPCNPRLHTKLTDQLSCLYVYINKTDESSNFFLLENNFIKYFSIPHNSKAAPGCRNLALDFAWAFNLSIAFFQLWYDLGGFFWCNMMPGWQCFYFPCDWCRLWLNVIHAGYDGDILLNTVSMSALNGSIGGHVGFVFLLFEQMRMVSILSFKKLIDFWIFIFLAKTKGRWHKKAQQNIRERVIIENKVGPNTKKTCKTAWKFPVNKPWCNKNGLWVCKSGGDCSPFLVDFFSSDVCVLNTVLNKTSCNKLGKILIMRIMLNWMLNRPVGLCWGC